MGANVIALTLYFLTHCLANLIANGDFSLPLLSTTFVTGCPSSWNCSQTYFFQPKSFRFLTQYMELYTGHWSTGTPGWISQTINLTTNGTYNFSIDVMSGTITTIQISWNSKPIKTQTVYSPSNVSRTIVFSFEATAGLNILKIEETGSNVSLCIDNVKMDYIPTPNNTITIRLILFNISIGSSLMNSLTSVVTALQSIYLLLSDLRLYAYAKKQFSGTVLMVFQATQYFQSIKFNSLPQTININISSSSLPISNYSVYTEQKFLKKQNSSFVLIETVFMFFVWTIPQTILMCVLIYGVWKFTLKYSCLKWINKRLRTYYFLKAVIIYSLLQQNLVYFSYVCFGHLKMAFTFNFYDKLSLILTVFVLYSIIMFCCIFFFFLGREKKRWTVEFNNGVLKGFKGNKYLTIRYTLRTIIRGAVFQFLHTAYLIQVILLGLIEFLEVINIFHSNFAKNGKLFENKLKLFFTLLYHILFGLLNTFFVLEEYNAELSKPIIQQNIILQTQTMLIYLLTAVVFAEILQSFLPKKVLKFYKVFIDCFRKKSPKTHQQTSKYPKKTECSKKTHQHQKPPKIYPNIPKNKTQVEQKNKKTFLKKHHKRRKQKGNTKGKNILEVKYHIKKQTQYKQAIHELSNPKSQKTQNNKKLRKKHQK